MDVTAAFGRFVGSNRWRKLAERSRQPMVPTRTPLRDGDM
jgi:hypothetical protein